MLQRCFETAAFLFSFFPRRIERRQVTQYLHGGDEFIVIVKNWFDTSKQGETGNHPRGKFYRTALMSCSEFTNRTELVAAKFRIAMKETSNLLTDYLFGVELITLKERLIGTQQTVIF